MSTEIDAETLPEEAQPAAVAMAVAIVAHNDQCVDFVELGQAFVQEMGGIRQIARLRAEAIKRAVDDGDLMTGAKLLSESEDWMKAASEHGKKPVRASDLVMRELAVALDFIGKVDVDAEVKRTENLSDTFGD